MNPEQFIVACMALSGLNVGAALYGAGASDLTVVFGGLATMTALTCIAAAASMQQVLLIDQSDDTEGNDNEW